MKKLIILLIIYLLALGWVDSLEAQILWWDDDTTVINGWTDGS